MSEGKPCHAEALVADDTVLILPDGNRITFGELRYRLDLQSKTNPSPSVDQMKG